MKKFYFAVLFIILSSIGYIAYKIPVKSHDSAIFSSLDYNIPIDEDYGLLLPGQFYYNSSEKSKKSNEPALLYIDPNKNFTIKTIGLKKFDFDFDGIHEARAFTVNGKYKIALGSFYQNIFSNKSAKLIILNNNKLDFDNLQVEFEEEVDDRRIRALYVEDIDHDGEKEIVIGTRPHGILKYYKLINNQWRGFQIDFFNTTIHDILVEDTDGNGLKEIIVTISMNQFNANNETDNFTGKIINYEFEPGKKIWNKNIVWEYNKVWTELPSGNVPKYEHARYLFASDIDEDGLNEIIVNVIGTGNIEFFKYNGTDYSREIIEDKLDMAHSAITMGDVDADNENEIIALTAPENTLLMYDHNDNFWEREILMENLFADKNKNAISYLSVINTGNQYGGLLIATGGITNPTDFYYLEHTDVWNKKHIGTTHNPLTIWGIFPVKG